MHFVANKTNLLKEIALVQGVAEKKNTIPILANLLLEAREGRIFIKATDLDLSITTTCDGEVLQEGALCVQAKKLFDIVRSLPESGVEIKSNEQGQIMLLCERSRFKMLGLSRENYPEIPEFRGAMASVPADLFQDFILRSIFAVTNEESRYALNGVKFELSSEGMRMVATDGHRLSFIEKKGGFVNGISTDMIIPKKTLTELLKLSGDGEKNIEFNKSDNQIFFKVGKRLLVSKVLNGQFPNYEMVLPKENNNKVLTNSELLSGAVKRVALMSDERSHAIKFEISNNQLTVTAQASDIGEAGENIPVEYNGEQITAGFNALYLTDFFNVSQGSNVSLEFKDGNTQVLLRPADIENYDFRYVVMPMRL